jgi:uncharacterized membrane protein YeiB
VPQFAAGIQKELVAEAAASARQIEDSIRVFSMGSYAEIFTERAGNLLYAWLVGLFYVPGFFAMFLLGLYAGKRRIFRDLEANANCLRRVLVWGLVIGLPANLMFTVGMAARVWRTPPGSRCSCGATPGSAGWLPSPPPGEWP